jgi:hypothetical protein
LEYAIKRKEFTRSIQIGLDFDKWFPEDMVELWYSRADLYRRLSEAYRGVGDAPTSAKFRKRSEDLYSITHVGSDPSYINERFNRAR